MGLSPSVLIRPVAPGDSLEQISGIYAAAWRTAYRGLVPDAYLERLDDGTWVPFLKQALEDCLLLEYRGRLVGTSCALPARDDRWSGWGEVVSLYLLPEYRGKGLGGPLLEAAVEKLNAQGFPRTYLWVLEANLPARRFYERHGFSPSGERTSSVLDGQEVWEVRYVRG